MEPLRVTRIPAAKLPGVWTVYGPEDGVADMQCHPVIDYLDVVRRGNTIVGSDYHHKLVPILFNNGRHGLQSITLQFGNPPHTPRVYHLPHPIYHRYIDREGQPRFFEFIPAHIRALGMNEPLPEDTIYEHPLEWPRPPEADRRELTLIPQHNDPYNPENTIYFYHQL